MPDNKLPRCFYRRDQLPEILQLPGEEIARLERTGQLTSIRICGAERFDSREVEALIDTYYQITQRKKNANVHF